MAEQVDGPGQVDWAEQVDSAEQVDWAGLMRLGLGALRLAPEVFWSMTPGELGLALEGAGLLPRGGSVMRRGRLDELMAAFPDAGADGGGNVRRATP